MRLEYWACGAAKHRGIDASKTGGSPVSAEPIAF
jgi:hypothetical protein